MKKAPNYSLVHSLLQLKLLTKDGPVSGKSGFSPNLTIKILKCWPSLETPVRKIFSKIFIILKMEDPPPNEGGEPYVLYVGRTSSHSTVDTNGRQLHWQHREDYSTSNTNQNRTILHNLWPSHYLTSMDTRFKVSWGRVKTHSCKYFRLTHIHNQFVLLQSFQSQSSTTTTIKRRRATSKKEEKNLF